MLSYGNKKLGDNVAVFSTSAGIFGSCGKNCDGCYALETEKLRACAALHRARNYELAKSDRFVYLMNKEIKISRCVFDYVRVHEGGEFFSQKYIDDWALIAVMNPEKVFYAYTSIMSGPFDFTRLLAAKNFILIDSYKARKGKVNFASEKELIDEGLESSICRLKKGEFCGKDCFYCMTKMAQICPPVFIAHGKKYGQKSLQKIK